MELLRPGGCRVQPEEQVGGMLVEAFALTSRKIQTLRYKAPSRLERSFQPGFHATQLFFGDDRIG